MFPNLPPKYTICITNYNMVRTIREALDSLLPQLDDSFEVVVCDNFSNDGSAEILGKYAAQRKLKLIQRNCNRGEGRQIAFNHSQGDYIITGLDMDDVFKPTLHTILVNYHTKYEGFMVVYGTVGIIPRSLVENVGGWVSLSAYEDVEFGRRARYVCDTSKYMWTSDASPIILKRGEHCFRLKEDQLGCLRILREIYVRAQISHAMNYNPPVSPNPSMIRRTVIAFIRRIAVGLLSDHDKIYRMLRVRGTLTCIHPSQNLTPRSGSQVSGLSRHINS